jgi:hypothetical protein
VKPQAIKDVLDMLEHLSRRTAMYVQPVEVDTVLNYLHGLKAGWALGGLYISPEAYTAAAAARGWKLRATGIVSPMREKKLSEAAIIQELIAVMAEAFRRAAGA